MSFLFPLRSLRTNVFFIRARRFTRRPKKINGSKHKQRTRSNRYRMTYTRTAGESVSAARNSRLYRDYFYFFIVVCFPPGGRGVCFEASGRGVPHCAPSEFVDPSIGESRFSSPPVLSTASAGVGHGSFPGANTFRCRGRKRRVSSHGAYSAHLLPAALVECLKE